MRTLDKAYVHDLTTWIIICTTLSEEYSNIILSTTRGTAETSNRGVTRFLFRSQISFISNVEETLALFDGTRTDNLGFLRE